MGGCRTVRGNIASCLLSVTGLSSLRNGVREVATQVMKGVVMISEIP